MLVDSRSFLQYGFTKRLATERTYNVKSLNNLHGSTLFDSKDLLTNRISKSIGI